MNEIEKFQKRIIKVDGISLTTKFGFHMFGNQRPYFSITADMHELQPNDKYTYCAGGCLHDDIERYQPELAPLIKWHLCSDDGLPMHYIANAIYWLEHVHQVNKYDFDIRDKSPKEVFESHIIWGQSSKDTQEVLDVLYGKYGTDDVDEYRIYLRSMAKRILSDRAPDLYYSMKSMMEAFDVEYIPTEQVMDKDNHVRFVPVKVAGTTCGTPA